MSSPPAPSRDRGAILLGRVAIALLAALPVVMAVAHRSSPLIISLAALFALAAAWREDRWAVLRRDLPARLSSPLGVAVLAFLAWAFASTTWSASLGKSLAALGEFVVPLAASLLLALTMPRDSGRQSGLLFVGGVALAAALVLLDLATGMAARQALGMRAVLFVLNRPALTLLVLLPVALWLCLRERRWGLAVGVAAIVAAAILRSESGAAKLGLIAMALAGGLTLLSRRAGLALAAICLLGALAVAPIAGEAAQRLLPPALYRALEHAHAQDRVDIWRSFGAALRQHPANGFGFGASAWLGETPVAARLAPEHAFFLNVGHPHDAALQIWVELGAIGAFLAALVAALVIRAMQALDRQESAVVVALIAAALADSMVGQGAWQGWWPAAIGASLVWFGYGRARDTTAAVRFPPARQGVLHG